MGDQAVRQRMKILLLGKHGQVGWELQRALAPLGMLVALDRHGADGLCGDVSRLDELAQTIRTVAPDIIVNAAAYTAVDQAESDMEQVRLINEQAVSVMARETSLLGALLVHYSTDYVFDGSGHTAWREDAPTRPLSVYGQSKLAGEQAILRSGCRYLIFRTSWVYAAKGHNFVKSMLRLATEREHMSVVNDQWGAPTGAELIADISAHAIRDALKLPEREGLYHLTASGETTWHAYAHVIIDHARKLGWPIKVTELSPMPTADYPTAAQRPLNSRLDTSRLSSVFGLAMPHWSTGVIRVLDELLAGDAR